ncbi:MAG TPA: 20S proteasome subunit A/B [Verrucomicrobiae bacterium]|jgi:proteasome alpha subunit|nr:20S proteasome subunit A/B [Verrucomicrobiae bacterium]
MTEEPYRWLEAIGNRREYVREQLKGGSPVFAVSLPDGVLLLGVGSGQSKVFELFDRHALAGLGHPADIEKIRQAAIDAAHIEAFTRAPEDVSLRRLVGFGLSPQLKTNFEQIFSAPFLVELLLAELGNEPAHDLFFRLHFDGAFQTQFGGVMVVASLPEAEASAKKWLEESLAGKTTPSAVVDILLQAWQRLSEGKSFADTWPEEGARQAAWREGIRGKVVEIGWLARKLERPARYQAKTLGDLGL